MQCSVSLIICAIAYTVLCLIVLCLTIAVKYPRMFQEQSSPGEHSTSLEGVTPFTNQSKHLPIEETQYFTRDLDAGVDQLDHDCVDRSATQGPMLEAQPVATLNSPQCLRRVGKNSRLRDGEYLEKIPEEGMSQGEEKHDTLKRTSSTASEARSSGYFSNPRSSNPRLSQLSIPESVVETDEQDTASLRSIQQRNCDEDEGLAIDISCTDDFIDNLGSGGVESEYSSLGSVEPSPAEPTANGVREDSVFPYPRPRCYQMTSASSRAKHSKDNELAPTQNEFRGRSKSLPNSSRHLHSTALHSTTCPSSSSSSTSLDSETTNGSPSEVSSRAGSQLSIASANSGESF